MNKFIAKPLKICDFKNTAQAIGGYHNFGHPRGYFGEPSCVTQDLTLAQISIRKMMALLSRSRYREWSKQGVLDVENLPQHPIQLVYVDGGVQSLPHDVTLQRTLRRPNTTFEHVKS